MMTKTVLGALVGALFGLVWATVGFGWACAVLLLTLVGAAVGYLLERPGRAIELLERLQQR
jgi:uncharacterized membrane protein